MPRFAASTIITGLLLSLTACAGNPPTVDAAAPVQAIPADSALDDAMNRAVGKAASEENLGLFFGLLRRSLSAAAEGKPAPELSAEEKARLEATGKSLQKDALEASMKMLDQVEKEMRDTLRTTPAGK